MTISDSRFNIKSVAIIGAGPSGIASVYDLTRITKDGKSLFGEKNVAAHELRGELLYDEVVAFERNPTVGGVWSRSVFHESNPDPTLPDFDFVGDLSNPQNIYKKFEISESFEEQLNESSFKNPVVKNTDAKIDNIIKYQWRGSGAYKGLFTNVTNQFMHFSFGELESTELDKINSKYKHIPMHQTAEDVSDYLENVVDENDLRRHIRLNSNVERVRKLDNGKWEILVSSIQILNDGSRELRWYKQYFDAVILSSGKSIPYIPEFKGLPEFVKANDKISYALAKTIKDPEFLQNKKKVLIVGASVSAVDLLQYTFPRDLENSNIFLSRTSSINAVSWVYSCSYSKGINNKPEIEAFLPEENAVKFTDGTVEYDFDAIIFATGYQTIYPYLDQKLVEDVPNLLDFYLYTFSLGDKTLALVGNTYTSFFFNRVESQAAALANVWGNFKQLPLIEDQEKQHKENLALRTPLVKEIFIDPLMNLAADERPHPFSINPNKSDHTMLTAIGRQHVENLWINLRDGKVEQTEILQTS